MSKLLFVCLFSFFAFMSCSPSIEAKEKVINSASEQYKIIQLLGSGAFGKVYAVKSSSGERYALKSIRQTTTDSDHLYLSAEREFERGQTLNHPHIIKSYEFFTHEAKPIHYVVLEYVNGKRLASMPKGQLGKRKACKIAMQLIAGLKHAAALHLYHLDLHPGNIMLTKHQELKIIDLASFISWDEVQKFFASKPNSYTSIQGIFQLQNSSNGDFRVMHKLNRFCNQDEELAQHLQGNKFNLIQDNDKENSVLSGFFKAYLGSIHSQMMLLFKLGDFKKEELRKIQTYYNNEMESFFASQGNQLHIESLLLFFDQLEKTFPDL